MALHEPAPPPSHRPSLRVGEPAVCSCGTVRPSCSCSVHMCAVFAHLLHPLSHRYPRCFPACQPAERSCQLALAAPFLEACAQGPTADCCEVVADQLRPSSSAPFATCLCQPSFWQASPSGRRACRGGARAVGEWGPTGTPAWQERRMLLRSSPGLAVVHLGFVFHAGACRERQIICSRGTALTWRPQCTAASASSASSLPSGAAVSPGALPPQDETVPPLPDGCLECTCCRHSEHTT